MQRRAFLPRADGETVRTQILQNQTISEPRLDSDCSPGLCGVSLRFCCVVSGFKSGLRSDSGPDSRVGVGSGSGSCSCFIQVCNVEEH